MKKYALGFIVGMLVMGGVSYAADLLVDAKSISYSSEYTEKDNVADAIDELLESNRIVNNNSIILNPYIMPIMTSASQDGVVVSPSTAYGIFDDVIDDTWGAGHDLFVGSIGAGGKYTVYLSLPKKLLLTGFELEYNYNGQYGLCAPSNTSVYGELDDGSYKQIYSCSSKSCPIEFCDILLNQFSKYKIEFTSPGEHLLLDELRLHLYEVV